MLDDETLRDGLQSPSVASPTIDEKIDILHRMDALGIDTADIGLPGAGPKVARGRRAAGARRSPTAACDSRQLRGAHDGAGHQADCRHLSSAPACRSNAARSSARARSGSTRKGGRSNILQKCTEEALDVRRQGRRRRDVRHRGHDARRSRVAAAAVHDGDSRPAPSGCVSPTRSAMRRRTARARS